MDSTNSKEMELIIKKYPHKVRDENNFDVTFEIANNTVSPFQSVDYFINGIYETVGVMGDAEEKQKGQIFEYKKNSIPIDKLTTIIDSHIVSLEPLPVASRVISDGRIPTTTGKVRTTESGKAATTGSMNWLNGNWFDSTTRPVSGFNFTNLFGNSVNKGHTTRVVSANNGISKTGNILFNNLASIVPSTTVITKREPIGITKASSLSDVLANSITNALKSKKNGGKRKNNRKTKKNSKK